MSNSYTMERRKGKTARFERKSPLKEFAFGSFPAKKPSETTIVPEADTRTPQNVPSVVETQMLPAPDADIASRIYPRSESLEYPESVMETQIITPPEGHYEPEDDTPRPARGYVRVPGETTVMNRNGTGNVDKMEHDEDELQTRIGKHFLEQMDADTGELNSLAGKKRPANYDSGQDALDAFFSPEDSETQ